MAEEVTAPDQKFTMRTSENSQLVRSVTTSVKDADTGRSYTFQTTISANQSEDPIEAVNVTLRFISPGSVSVPVADLQDSDSLAISIAKAGSEHFGKVSEALASFRKSLVE